MGTGNDASPGARQEYLDKVTGYTSTEKVLSKDGVKVGVWMQWFSDKDLSYFCRVLNGEKLPVKCWYSVVRGDILVACSRMAMLLITDLTKVGEICVQMNKGYELHKEMKREKAKNPTEE